MSNTSGVQQACRDYASVSVGDPVANWHAVFDTDAIAAGDFNGRTLAWINAKLGRSYSNLPEATNSFAIHQGFRSWADMDTVVFNIALDPRDFSQTTWAKNTTTVTADNAVAPNGLAEADLVTATGTGSNLASTTGIAMTAGRLYTLSVYVKPTTANFMMMTLSDQSAHAFGSYFNLQTGALGSSHSAGDGTVATRSIVPAPVDGYSGWYVAKITGSVSNQRTLKVDIRFPSADGSITTANGNAGLLWNVLWG